MPFIGNQPALSYTSFAKQDFTTSATTSYTLDHPVTNENEIALFINFVRQEPTTAYTATNTTLTLTSATSATDDMYCVFLGKAVQTVNPPSGSVGLSQLSATGTKNATTFLRGDNTFAEAGGGIEEADMWRLTTDITANVDPIASNLERVDDASFAKIGTGMTVSSGIWSFPVTGLYQVTVNAALASNGDDNVSINIYATLNNSSYDHVANAWGGTDGGGAAGTNTGTAVAFVNVTDVSNVKVKFTVGSVGSGSSVLSDTNVTYTGFNFIRLGDSQ